MALIVDDRDDVWRGEQAKNLLLVRPYKFFVVSQSEDKVIYNTAIRSQQQRMDKK